MLVHFLSSIGDIWPIVQGFHGLMHLHGWYSLASLHFLDGGFQFLNQGGWLSWSQLYHLRRKDLWNTTHVGTDAHQTTACSLQNRHAKSLGQRRVQEDVASTEHVSYLRVVDGT